MKTVTRTGDDPAAVPPPDDELVMTMLQEHVPLALLCDLTEPERPDVAGDPRHRGRAGRPLVGVTGTA